MKPTLSLVPCFHFWLEVHAAHLVTAICKFKGCRETGRFTKDQWDYLAARGHALNKPVRV